MHDLYQAHTIIRTGSDILATFFHCLDFILPICDRLNLAIFKKLNQILKQKKKVMCSCLNLYIKIHYTKIQTHYGHIKCLKKYFTEILAWNKMFFSALNNPKSPWYLKPSKAELNKSYIKAKLNKTFNLISHSFRVMTNNLKAVFVFT